MVITFRPSIGETATILSPLPFPQKQSTPVLFTARLNASDYAQLIADDGTVELWSDIPSSNNSSGIWNEKRFVDPNKSQGRPGRYNLNKNESDGTQFQSLYLQIILPPLEEAQSLHFCFTYRISYPSGNIIWLGNFGQNGQIILNVPAACFTEGLTLSGEWFLDASRKAYVHESSEEGEPIEVASILNASNFDIQALDVNGFKNNLKGSSVLFLVPKSSELHPALWPTYILSASPHMLLSVIHNTSVTVSGTGSLLLQVQEQNQDPSDFTKKIFSHSGLDNWIILAADVKKQVVAIANKSENYPIHGRIISFWYSTHVANIELDALDLGNAFEDGGTKEYVFFVPETKSVSILPVPRLTQIRAGAIQFDQVHATAFILAPVHRLNGPTTREDWAAAVMTYYKTTPLPLSTHNVKSLPTPPPSPGLSQTMENSKRSSMSLIESSSKNLLETNTSNLNEREHIEDTSQRPLEPIEDSPNSSQDDLSQVSGQHQSPIYLIHAAQGFACKAPQRVIFWVYQSVMSTFRLAFKLFHCPWRRSTGDVSSSLRQESAPAENEDTRSAGEPSGVLNSIDQNSIENNSIDGTKSALIDDASLNVVGRQVSSRMTTTSTTENATFSGSRSEESSTALPLALVAIPSIARLQEPDISKSTYPMPRDNTFYSEIFPCNFHDDNVDGLVPDTTLDVMFLPLPIPKIPSNNVTNNEGPPSSQPSHTALRKAVTFINKNQTLECDVTPIQTLWYSNEAHGAESDNCDTPETQPIHIVSYLLRYHLGSENIGRGQIVSIEAPED